MADLRLTPTVARRLAVTRQRLAGPRPRRDEEGILDLVRELACLQLDPTSAVARSHLLVLWSRVGPYDPDRVGSLLWERRALFEYWAHAASIVPVSDYPIHEATMMRRYGRGDRPLERRLRDWVAANDALRRRILAQLRKHGALRAADLDGHAKVSWGSDGWSGDRDLGRMLDFLWMRGRILVAGRAGQARVWDLAERCLPAEALELPRLRQGEAVRLAAERSLRSLGVATARHIREHFVRGRYSGLDAVLRRLERDGKVVRASIAADGGEPRPGTWYLHADDLPLVERLRAGEWEPRTTLLSPFDNLIADRTRTEELFGFRFRIEIYVPKEKRRHGYFVLPVLDGDRLVGRVDPIFDRSSRRLVVNAVHAEDPASSEAGPAVAGAVEELAGFLGAGMIDYAGPVPRAWRRVLR